MTIEINKASFTLLGGKALYKNDERLLIIADVHLGKASHFRKEGIPIPARTQMTDYDNLIKLFKETDPLKVYFLGDLFHSAFNRDWHYFTGLVNMFPDVDFTLVRGNHDIIDEELFRQLSIEVVETLEEGDFIYSHEPLEQVPPGKKNIVGHIHPGITLAGSARQSVTLPCFYIEDHLMILPAFGTLTGLYRMEVKKRSEVYVVSAGKVHKL